jgi:hypothetical protein
MNISKEGDRYLRTMLVQGAHYILGPLEQTVIYGVGQVTATKCSGSYVRSRIF